jgi:hypothetical protein
MCIVTNISKSDCLLVLKDSSGNVIAEFNATETTFAYSEYTFTIKDYRNTYEIKLDDVDLINGGTYTTFDLLYTYLVGLRTDCRCECGGGGGGTVSNVSALTLGTTGTDLSSSVANSTTTPVITLNVPTASATNRGVLSSTDWSTFNNKLDTSIGLYYINRATSGFTPIVGATSGISYSYEIPAGTMIIGDIATTDLFVDRTGGTGNMTIRFYFNTTNSISGAILAGTATYANTNLYAGITRTFSVESSTVTNAFNTGASASGDIPSGVASAMSVLNIDWSVPQWIIIHISMAGTGSATCKMFRMYK